MSYAGWHGTSDDAMPTAQARVLSEIENSLAKRHEQEPIVNVDPSQAKAVAFMFFNTSKNARKMQVYYENLPEPDVLNPRVIVNRLSEQSELSIQRSTRLFAYLSLCLQFTEWTFQIFVSPANEKTKRGTRRWDWAPYMVNWARDGSRNEILIHPWNGVLEPAQPWKRAGYPATADHEHLYEAETIGLIATDSFQ